VSRAVVANLAIELRKIPKSRASIMYENALGQDLARSIYDAFIEAGWGEARLSTGSGMGEGITVGWSSRAVAIGDALKGVARLPGVWAKDTEKEVPDLVVVGVGINTFGNVALT